ncbi:uncharacterized protein LOC127927422 isoform X2 [Oncorhynchus keta]|uniref:uncharacterized protein LOC127927422 isoform X1 n=1 Tax=Oncorhynchus keta TaxID=8018 RepID=UPI00227A315D|nr:uncharacterized protein LOC127927422 isoform X1 [Oncorhynchus keta]XP_052369752.1 uncharacterized protein LOC127927422 isoform X2 [Oncorhynchus keta]
MYELFYKKYCNISIKEMTSQDQMRLLYEALEEAEDPRRVKSDFYRILMDLESELVINLGAIFVDIHKDQLIRRVTKVMPILHELFYEKLYRDISIKDMTSQDQMEQLYQALEEAEDSRSAKLDFYRILLDLEPDLVIDLGASFVDVHKDQLIRRVTKVMPILHELFYEKLYRDISIKEMTRQDQMEQLYQALEEAEDSRSAKLDFYRILLDLEPDLVIDLGEAKETNQSLSTSPGGQQETQTPSQRRKSVPEMEIKSLPGPGRKSVPGSVGKSVPGSGGKSVPGSGGKSVPEMEMETLLGPGLQNDLDEMERGGRVTTDYNSML